jgi:NAD(P)-dependent dehydrogenase (short-subunit alcohol dehydrogenase family)
MGNSMKEDSGCAVIVGAGAGLGAALARRAKRGGLTVVMVARQSGRLEALAQSIGGRAVACDATREADVERLFDTVAREFGAPRLAVYNAGAFVPKSILATEAGEFEDCWRIICLGGFLVGRAAARPMAAAGVGTILFTGATASLRGGANFANLAVGKFGLRALAQSMARELGPKGVHVAHVVIDGMIAADHRPGRKASEHGPDTLLDADAIAESYWQLHQQPRSAWTQELDVRPWSEKF